MSKIIGTADAFVESWKKDQQAHPEWAMKVVIPRSKKQGDEYVVASRRYVTVKSAYQVEIDFTQFKKGDHVELTGELIKEEREWEGKTYSDDIWLATAVTIIPSKRQNAAENLKNIGATPVGAEEAF